MKYLEISVGGSVNQITGESWLKVNLSASIEEGEDIDECIKKAKAKVAEHLFPNDNSVKYDIAATFTKNDKGFVSNDQTEQSPQQLLQEQIESCTTIKVLESYKMLVEKKYPELKLTYESMYKKLSV